MFDIFKRKKEKIPTDKEVAKFIDVFNQLWSTNIKDIWAIEDINSFVIAMIGWVSKKCNYGKNIVVLTPKEKVVYVVATFQSEVNNGGFAQFLYNCGGFTDDLLSSLNCIGAVEIAEIYIKALENVPCQLPMDDKKRDAVLDGLITERISQIFDGCDQQFYDCSDKLENLLYNFIINNKESFV